MQDVVESLHSLIFCFKTSFHDALCVCIMFPAAEGNMSSIKYSKGLSMNLYSSLTGMSFFKLIDVLV